MQLPDVNVLVHAFRPDSPSHAAGMRWLNSALDGPHSFAISPQILAAVVRVTTNSKAFSPPTEIVDALNFCDFLRSHPLCSIVAPGPRHWEIFARVCTESGAAGNLISDAWYAALAIEWDCEWVSFDRDFVRFSGLRWTIPQ